MTRERPHGGLACLEIRRDEGGKWPLCAVRQAIDAAPYRGRRVRLSGWLRFEPPDSAQVVGSAQIWIRAGGRPWSYDDLGEHPVRFATWTFAQVVCEVAPDADSIAFGGALNMYGKAWDDDLKLVVLGANGEGNEPAHALDERGMENLIAFGRLLGYVHPFHPSGEAAANDWDSFAIAGVGEVEGARTPAELKARLERLFRPLAPTLRLSTKPLPPVAIAALRRPGVAPERITGWQHRGWAGRFPEFSVERRILAPAEAPGDSLLPIGSEVNTALGGGVWCSVPLTLYTGAHGTVPHGVGLVPTPQRPDGWVPTGTDADLQAALPKINAGKGVIFDLRGYPYRTFTSVIAHLTDSTVTSPRWGFPVILRPDHRDTTCAWENYSVEPESQRIRAHAAFLIDGNAISAAETLLGVVERYHLADLVGEPTAGTNGNVTSVRLPGMYSISFTGLKVLKQDGSRHHGVGILPTVPVSPTIAGIAAGRDEQLERAVEVVRH